MKTHIKIGDISRYFLFLSSIPSLAIASTLPISQDPVLKSTSVPGNVALALSVEFPTALVNAHKGDFDPKNEYLGYFDPRKCYTYLENKLIDNKSYSYFSPDYIKKPKTLEKEAEQGCGNSTGGKWDGNFLNWAVTSTIDPFRWVMTGGDRLVDKENITLLLKSYDNGKSYDSNEKRYFPDRNVSNATMQANTPLTGDRKIIIYKEGNHVNFRNGSTDQKFHVLVQVCKEGFLESNCTQYKKGSTDIWKPEGLIQKYSRDLRFSAFGYLNDDSSSDDSSSRDAGVMRAPMRFVGPYDEFTATRENPNKEWDEETGIFIKNPSPELATETSKKYGLSGEYTIQNSGLINYINKFGQQTQQYKFRDPVSELYYAITRYFRKSGNIAAWSQWNENNREQIVLNSKEYLEYKKNNSSTLDSGARSLSGLSSSSWNSRNEDTKNEWRVKYFISTLSSQDINNIAKFNWLDSFPVVTEWDNPIAFSCQKNSILGIGDIFSNDDTNIPTLGTASFQDNDLATYYTNPTKNVIPFPALGTGISSYHIATLADFANNFDLRPEKEKKPGTEKQTIQTYWVDVLEDGVSLYNNQYYLAAMFGGPSDWQSADDLDMYTSYGGWNKKNDPNTHVKNPKPKRPKNYFQAGNPASMKAGLEDAFEKMSWDAKNLSSTAFSFTNNDLTYNNTYYSVTYDSQYWSSNIKAHQLDAAGEIVIDNTTKKPKVIWQTEEKFPIKISQRKILTWSWKDDSAKFFDPEILSDLSEAQKKSLDTSYINGDDSKNFAKWLIGDSQQTQYRSRLGAPDANNKRHFNPLGDIINSKIIASGAPSQTFSELDNPGYKKFKDDHKNRETILFVGANDGMLHGIRTADSNGGEELFAYMPSSFFLPEAGSDTNEAVITKLGKHYYNHRNYVDATVAVADVDFKRAGNTTHQKVDKDTHDWRTILVGGLGAGGYQYYALDVTQPDSFLNQETAPNNVLWEFPRVSQIPQALGGQCTSNCIDIGMTFGTPNIIKTKKYGWVVAVTSGYNNASGQGKLYLLNPQNGDLLETHSTNKASNGLAHTTAFIPVYSNMLADSIYGGDINGQVWRFDLTDTNTTQINGIYSAHLLAELTSPGTGQAQPITTRPIVQVHPKDRKRYVLLGTGRLLDSTDLDDKQIQSFYALADGTAGRFSTKSEAITRTNLGQTTILSAIAEMNDKNYQKAVEIANGQAKAATGLEAAQKTEKSAREALENAKSELTAAEASQKIIDANRRSTEEQKKAAKNRTDKARSDLATAEAALLKAEADLASAQFALSEAKAAEEAIPELKKVADDAKAAAQEAAKIPPTKYGWVLDLGMGSANGKDLSWRNIFNATIAGGNVSFSSTLPVANYCEGTGSSRVYAIDFMHGSSILLNTDSTPRAYLEHNFVNFDTQFVRIKDQVKLWTGGGDGQIFVEDKLNLTQEPRGQLSWREIPVAQ